MRLPQPLSLLALASLLSVALPRQTQAQAGKDGALTVSAANSVVNRYTALTADAAAGATTLTVASTTGLSTGDLVMIIQMQGATINTTNTSAYGAVTAYNSAGNYELAVVQGVGSSTSFGLSQPLSRGYAAAGKAQVVRIPRHTTITINAGGSVVGTAWNGTSGGVVALEAQGTTTINGSITATGQGFRGGAFSNNATSNNTSYVGTGNTGGEKGESIAGYGASYAVGSRGRGAPANGGGGGNSVNAGGGGGGNGGSVASWTGKGRPSTTTGAWASAWNLESAGFATSSSTGGGRGGYGVSDNDLDALTVGPDNSSWGAYNRPNTGGFGGRPLDYSTNRLYLGGGGGAGDGNTSVAGIGGNGGGLIYLIGPDFTGSGSVVSNGTNGATSQANNPFADGAGGGGAGGTIVVNASTSVTSIALTANGGAGGNTENTVDKGYGPGGGGAGYVGLASVSFSNVTLTQQGGANGVSTSPGLTEFPPNGATRGGTSSFAFFSTTPTPLPVTWLRFTATRDGRRTKLSWATATELRTRSFVPERSVDGRQFAAFGEPVAAAGTSLTQRNYTSYDAAPPAQPVVYYRVRQVDTDGSASYTPVVAVRPEGNIVLGAYPVPVRRGQLLHTTLPAGTGLQLSDLLGRRVAVPTQPAPDGTLDVDTQALPAGSYLLTVPGSAAQRLVVQE